MSHQYISPNEAGPTNGRYNKAVKAGNRVFVAGQVPVDPEGNVVGAGDFEQQAAQVTRTTDIVLQAAAGMSVSDMAMTRIYTTNVAHRDLIARERERTAADQSTATLAEINGLMNPYMMLEISGIAHEGSEKQVIRPDTVHQPRFPYVPAVRADDTLYISGQIARDPQGNLVGQGDAEAQADQAARNLIRVLEAAGADAADVVYTCLYITDPAYIPAVRAARRSYGLLECTSTLVVVPSLARADLLVEIEAIAVPGAQKRIIKPEDVHEVSGRYEHAVVVGDTIYLAGQVGLDPEGNLVGQGDADAQARQLYENMSRVLRAAGASLEDVVSTTTYMTNLEHRDAVNRARFEYGVTQSANTALVITGLAMPELLLEVEAIAVLPRE